MTFIEKCLAGEAFTDEIENYEEAWHNGREGKDMNLHEYLGMTWEEYSIWVTRPSILAAIVQCRKKGISLKEELDQERIALAARDETHVEVQKIAQWLKEIGRFA